MLELSQRRFSTQNKKVSTAAQRLMLPGDETSPCPLAHLLAALVEVLLDLLIQTVPSRSGHAHEMEHVMADMNASLLF